MTQRSVRAELVAPIALSLSKGAPAHLGAGTPFDKLRAIGNKSSVRTGRGGWRNAKTSVVSAALLVCLLSGCAVEPWVKPYERERLADPIMKFSRDPIAERHREHVYDVREGARGATGVQGGGCGCN